MTPFVLAALTFIFIPFGVYFVLGWFIFYHLERYGIRGDSTRQVALFFAVILIIISLLILLAFFSINWDKASIGDFIERSNINLGSKYE